MTERIKTPHPHALLMMEYAKDCLTDSEAWRNWECHFASDESWQTLDRHPSWVFLLSYRRKPNKIIKKFINGIEVPMHLTEKPKLGETYYCIDSVINVGDHRIGVDTYEWSNDKTDYSLYESNNCFATEEDAQANLDAIQKFELREEEECVINHNPYYRGRRAK